MEENKNYNEIDTECDIAALDEDDFGFGSSSENHLPERVITGSVTPSGALDIQKNFKSSTEPDYSGCNQIDMECEDFDDTEDFEFKMNIEKFDDLYAGEDLPENSRLDFGDDEERPGFFSEEHINLENTSKEDLEEEISKRSILSKKQQFTREDLNLGESKKDEGTVSINYWRDLAKKHAATNKKGARGYFELFGNFDPEKNMELFNHDMTPQSNIPQIKGGLLNTSSDGEISGDITGSEGASEGGQSQGGESIGESLESDQEKITRYRKLFKDIRFDVNLNKEGLFEVKDLIIEEEPAEVFKSFKEVVDYLKPYITDELSIDEDEVEEYLKNL